MGRLELCGAWPPGFWQGRRKESAEEREEREERERRQPKRKGLMERITGTSDKSVSTVYTAIVTNALVLQRSHQWPHDCSSTSWER